MKELTIEQKAYNEALERARQLLRTSVAFDRFTIEKIFPELKESEDEKIRKELIKFVKVNIPDEERYIAWLEKQGEQKPQGKSALEAWKDMRLEVYQQASGNRHEPNYSDDTTKMFSLNDIDEIFEKIAETCEQKPVDYENTTIVQKDFAPKSAMEAIKEEKIDNANKVEPKDYNSIDPHFFKTTDKVESKFKLGDFIVNDYCSGKVIKITDDAYLLDTGQGIPFSCEHNVHLWNVTKDAKDGDVLATDKSVFIYAEVLYNKPYAYCGVDKFGVFKDNCREHDWTNSVDNIHPATKEQRELLFQKMKEAGYDWDAEKKELKKLGQSEVTKMSDQEEIAEIPFGAKDSELQEVTYFIPKGFHAEIDDDKVVIKKGEKPTAWSEEDGKNSLDIKCLIGCYRAGDDEYRLDTWIDNLKKRVQSKQEWSDEDEQITLSIEQVMNCASLLNIVPEKIDKIRTWLKSLKDRYTWKPSEEQMKALHDLNLTGNISYAGQGQVLIELYNNLKKLTE